MERVQFQQEQMLAELKDLVQKGVFSQTEIRQIMKKRTTFETALIRRIPKKGDFLRYAAYEMSLEALRRKRVERLKIPKGPPTISDFALIRRQFQIFERALKKFKDDVGLWVQYIQAAQRAQARALVSRVCGRALQLHPNTPALYVLAAAHELKHLSHAAARVLLQRGIRMNSENIDLWREYVKMEMGFVEALRRRWGVLGLKVAEEAVEKEAGLDVDMDASEGAAVIEEDMPSLEGEAEEADEMVRKEILKGALVKTVVSNAVKAVPTTDLFTSIHSVITAYPCPPSLRRCLLDHLHSLLQSTLLSSSSKSSSPSKSDLKTTAQAAKLYATRFLTHELEGEALVDTLRRANEDLLDLVRTRCDDDLASVYAQFIQEWFEKGIDEHLNLYLLASLQSICSSSRSSSLLALHLRLLRSPQNPNTPTTTKLLKLAKKYSQKSPQAVEVWLIRLGLESTFQTESEDGWKKVWDEARRQFPVKGGENSSSDSRKDEIWFWGLDYQVDRPVKEQISTLEALLREARAEPTSTLLEKLLIRYIRLLQQRAEIAIRTGRPTPYQRGDQSKDFARVASLYLPSAGVWAAAFDIYAHENELDPNSDSPLDSSASAYIDEHSERESTLRTVYERWRLTSPVAHSAAALKWAGWLVRHGRGGEAARVVANARSALGGDDAAVTAFDQQWRGFVDRMETAEDEAIGAASGSDLDLE